MLCSALAISVFSSELHTDPRKAIQIDANSSEYDIERQRKLANKKYIAERKAAAGEESH